MKTMAKLMFASAMFAMAFDSFADDGSAYVTGAECEVSNDWLIVKSGSGTITNQFKVTGYTATRIRIEEGAALALGIDAPFNPKALLCVFGTLDLYGHNLNAVRIDNSIPFTKAASSTDITALDTNSLRRTSGRIVNTSNTDVTLNLTSSGETIFYGSIEECPGKIFLETANAPFQYYGTGTDNPLSAVTVTNTSTLRYENAPHRFKFVFQPPSDSTVPIRLGEIEI